MKKYFMLILIVLTAGLVGCSRQIGGYTAAASISRNGFARNAQQIQALAGQEVQLWGYVDHGNMYGDESAKAILGEWWGGEGPDANTWRFNLKAGENDDAGQSFAVYVPNGAGRDDLLRKFAADAQAGRPTRVFLTGTLSTFEAHTANDTLTGITLEVPSSGDVLLEPPN